ncbi:hypothetical protein CYMTET_17583 [Cymbomonas tetramitiformis]|uniref:Transmembrane protein n=1 Tax=Cymbomonas tetramitiformis TaxID=36881 RepID=A0AAE0GA16_9CHLO|nr:hypothetical protein CYMTET_17583 [Cymbomonas tetramitiformis]
MVTVTVGWLVMANFVVAASSSDYESYDASDAKIHTSGASCTSNGCSDLESADECEFFARHLDHPAWTDLSVEFRNSRSFPKACSYWYHSGSYYDGLIWNSVSSYNSETSDCSENWQCICNCPKSGVLWGLEWWHLLLISAAIFIVLSLVLCSCCRRHERTDASNHNVSTQRQAFTLFANMGPTLQTGQPKGAQMSILSLMAKANAGAPAGANSGQATAQSCSSHPDQPTFSMFGNGAAQDSGSPFLSKEVHPATGCHNFYRKGRRAGFGNFGTSETVLG